MIVEALQTLLFVLHFCFNSMIVIFFLRLLLLLTFLTIIFIVLRCSTYILWDIGSNSLLLFHFIKNFVEHEWPHVERVRELKLVIEFLIPHRVEVEHNSIEM